MKTDFEARPAFAWLEARLRAHFLTYFLTLLVYRILEKSWETAILVKKS